MAEYEFPDILDSQSVAVEYLRKTRKGFRPAKLTTCEGDLILICNALLDYADICDRVKEDLEPFQKASMTYYANRFRQISEKYGKAIGYSREEAIRKCERNKARKSKQDDIGEDALTILVNRGNQEVTGNG